MQEAVKLSSFSILLDKWQSVCHPSLHLHLCTYANGSVAQGDSGNAWATHTSTFLHNTVGTTLTSTILLLSHPINLLLFFTFSPLTSQDVKRLKARHAIYVSLRLGGED